MNDPKPGEVYRFNPFLFPGSQSWRVKVLFTKADKVYYQVPGTEVTSDCTLDEFRFMYKLEDQS